MQNEILDIMAVLTLLGKLKTIWQRWFFSINADERTDGSNKEQLFFCLRPVDENLNAFGDFKGFYQLENAKSDTIVHMIKEILIIMNLILRNCRGQTYNGTLNMAGKKSGVLTQVLVVQPKVVVIHYQEHSLSISAKSINKECDVLHDTMSVVEEICIPLKLLPKQEHLPGIISDNIEKEDSEAFKKLKKLSGTRWTVHAECVKRVIDNYESLLKLWEECLK